MPVSSERDYNERVHFLATRTTRPELARRVIDAEAEVERLREALATETVRRAKILRLTYDEDMPDHLANAIRSLCAS